MLSLPFLANPREKAVFVVVGFAFLFFAFFFFFFWILTKADWNEMESYMEGLHISSRQVCYWQLLNRLLGSFMTRERSHYDYRHLSIDITS